MITLDESALAGEIQSRICDWNSPRHLASDMDTTCRQLAIFMRERVADYIESIELPKRRLPIKCSAGALCDGDMCCDNLPYENQAYNQGIKDCQAKLDEAVKELRK